MCVLQVVYKNWKKLPVYSDSSLLARTDISHAKEASRLASQVAPQPGEAPYPACIRLTLLRFPR